MMAVETAACFLTPLTRPVKTATFGSMTVALENFMGLQAAAGKLGLSRSRVQQFCAEGRLGEKVDGRWLVSETEIRLFLQIQRPRGRRPQKTPKPQPVASLEVA